ncbi:hypothetical protein [Duganella sp. Root1480D1]|uniref:hypothetical protein n=1 Tax=Duganella sp. Root1480D1 TaxID=1736471 RepID=UPI0007106036|nr:hypothetical protein [Duganella sp. Root1480D1]KQZ42578.1 hypothetical protein ASD58_24780 [Duganella sp. Root1480D1]
MIAHYLFHHTNFIMATSINGIGTTFYGQSDFESDGSFITTKWVIFAYLPIVPTGSLRVRYAEDQGFFSTGTSYEVLMELPIEIPQVLRIWGYVLSFGLLLSLLSKGPDAIWKFVIFGGMAALPYTLRRYAKRRAEAGTVDLPPQRKTGTAPAVKTRLEDLPRVSTCPKCRYTRKPDDYAPAWQCPSCKVAYNKVSN